MNSSSFAIPVRRFLEREQEGGGMLQWTLLGEHGDLNRPLETGDINRPGMNLFGYFEYFAWGRIQIFGRGESAYLEKLDREGRMDELSRFFDFPIPCIAFSYGRQPPASFLAMADRAKIPVFVSSLGTPQLLSQLSELFARCIAPQVVVNGVMLEVFSVGILLIGEPGIGKTECALELIERGHRFIADDTVEIRSVNRRTLISSPTRVNTYHMKIAGLGILNIAHLFGVGAIRPEKQIDAVVELVAFDKAGEIDPLSEDSVEHILDVAVPRISVPVRPGSNLPVLIETAAMNQRLKMMGYHAAREFARHVEKEIHRSGGEET